MPKTDEKIAEIMLEQFRAMREHLSRQDRKADEILTEVRGLRRRELVQDEEMNAIREMIYAMQDDISRLKARTDLID